MGSLTILVRKCRRRAYHGIAADLAHSPLSVAGLVHNAAAEMSLSCRERANLAVQLKDTKSVVGRLKFVISIVLHLVFIFFYLMIYNVSCSPSLLSRERP